jgi:hypothetical protein
VASNNEASLDVASASDDVASLSEPSTSETQELKLVDASMGRELKKEQRVVPGELSTLRSGAHKLEKLAEQALDLLHPTRSIAKAEAKLEHRAAHAGASTDIGVELANDAKLERTAQDQVLNKGEKLTLHAAAATAELSLAHSEAWSQVGDTTEEETDRSFQKLRKTNAELRKLSDLTGKAAAAAKKMETAARTAVQEQRKAKVLSKEQMRNAHNAKRIQQLAAAAQGHEDTAAARLQGARREATRVAAQIEQMSNN